MKRPLDRGLFCFQTAPPKIAACDADANARQRRADSLGGIALSFRPDPGRFDDRPPFFDLGFLLCCKPARRLFVARPRLLSKLDEALTHRRIRQSFNYGT